MPDIKNKTDYEAYQKTVAEFIEQEHLSFISAGVENNDPWFSGRPCECCQSALGGMREHMHAIEEESQIQVEYTICEDCVYYLNYGRLDDTTMLRIETV